MKIETVPEAKSSTDIHETNRRISRNASAEMQGLFCSGERNFLLERFQRNDIKADIQSAEALQKADEQHVPETCDGRSTAHCVKAGCFCGIFSSSSYTYKRIPLQQGKRI